MVGANLLPSSSVPSSHVYNDYNHHHDTRFRGIKEVWASASSTAAPAPAAHNAEGKLTGASFLLFPTNQQKTHTVAINSLYTIWH